MGDVRLVARKLDVGHAGRPVLSGVDLTLRAGSVSVLVGPNGCGKSTLLRTVAGLLPPLGGEVEVDGASPGSLSRRLLSQRLAFLPQSSLTPAGVTVRELVRHGRYAHRGVFGRHTSEDAEAVDGVHVLQAGTRVEEPGDQLVSAGGRVLSVVALGDDLTQARDRAYEATARISLRGAHHRGDIAARAAAGQIEVPAHPGLLDADEPTRSPSQEP